MSLFYKLVIGDWTDVAKNIESHSIGLCVTSPPYIDMRGVMYWSSYDAFLDKMKDCFMEVYRVLKPGRIFALNISPGYIWKDKNYNIGFDLLNLAMKDCNFKLEEPIVWVKPTGMNSGASKRFGNFLKQSYPFYYKVNRIYEFIFILTKGPMTRITMGSRTKQLEESKVLGDMKAYNSNVWRLGTSSQDNPWNYKFDDSAHTAMYPQLLSDLVIQFYSLVGDVVLDPFVGSGTTILSAINYQRSCIGIEMREELIPLIKRKCNWQQQSIGEKIEWSIEE